MDDGIILDGNVIKQCNDRLRKHIVNTDELILRGRHMYENVCTALGATATLVEAEKAIEVIKENPRHE